MSSQNEQNLGISLGLFPSPIQLRARPQKSSRALWDVGMGQAALEAVLTALQWFLLMPNSLVELYHGLGSIFVLPEPRSHRLGLVVLPLHQGLSCQVIHTLRGHKATQGHR